MPWMFIGSLLFLAIAVLCGITAKLLPASKTITKRDSYGRSVTRDSGGRAGALAATAVAALVGLLFLALASFDVVPTRNVGIVTSFNKPTGEVTGAGFQGHEPWLAIDDWDASRQAWDHRHEKSCVAVRLATLSDGCVEVLIEWHVKPGQAPEQWASYKRDFEIFVKNRVDPNFAMAVNDALASHNPLANIDRSGNLNVPLAPFAQAIKDKIDARIGEDVEVLTVTVSRINYDQKTQNSIDQFQQTVSKARTLAKEQENALLQKRITETNAQVPAVTRCLEIADKLGKEPGLCLGGGNPVQVIPK